MCWIKSYARINVISGKNKKQGSFSEILKLLCFINFILLFSLEFQNQSNNQAHYETTGEEVES